MTARERKKPRLILKVGPLAITTVTATDNFEGAFREAREIARNLPQLVKGARRWGR